MDLDAIEAGFDGIFGRLSVVVDEALDFVDGQGSGDRRVALWRDVAAADDFGVEFLEHVRIGGSAEGPELEVYVGAF